MGGFVVLGGSQLVRFRSAMILLLSITVAAACSAGPTLDQLLAAYDEVILRLRHDPDLDVSVFENQYVEPYLEEHQSIYLLVGLTRYVLARELVQPGRQNFRGRLERLYVDYNTVGGDAHILFRAIYLVYNNYISVADAYDQVNSLHLQLQMERRFSQRNY